MDERLRNELEMLKQSYPGVQYDERQRRVTIAGFPMPPGWNRATTTLVFSLPVTYPETSPDNFYVETGLRLASGEKPDNYTEDGGSPIPGYGVFSWHPKGAWRCATPIEAGDNLVTFVRHILWRLRAGK
ncbi:MAG TPA: E2/UBC family protein [Planctomycetota bacterium]|nr:E2/UBC family protein [Planctomycetota bacterium]